MESGAWPVWPNGAPRWPLPETAVAEPAETTVAGEARPLDDVMLAMDVVDTLRHSRRLVDKELASEEDDARLLRRLRDTYASQGIEVPDEILRQGVAALKENRFVYTPPPSGFWAFLARLYVTRKRWRADLFAYAILIALAWQWDSFGIQAKVRSLIDWPATVSPTRLTHSSCTFGSANTAPRIIGTGRLSAIWTARSRGSVTLMSRGPAMRPFWACRSD
jgi:hypothetical protein